MTVQELIDELQQVSDKSKEVIIESLEATVTDVTEESDTYIFLWV
jgi:hypothetical protein